MKDNITHSAPEWAADGYNERRTNSRAEALQVCTSAKNMYDKATKIIHEFEAGQDALTNFLPTAEQVNALPKGIKNYIYHLETNADPAGMVAENVLTMDENRALVLSIAEAHRERDALNSQNAMLRNQVRKYQELRQLTREVITGRLEIDESESNEIERR